MADYATKNDVQEIVTKAVTKAVDDLSEVIQNFAQNVDERFNLLKSQIDTTAQNISEANIMLEEFLAKSP